MGADLINQNLELLRRFTSAPLELVHPRPTDDEAQAMRLQLARGHYYRHDYDLAIEFLEGVTEPGLQQEKAELLEQVEQAASAP